MVCVTRFEKFTRYCLLSVTSWLLSALHREPTHGDHVSCYGGPRRVEAGTVGQLQIRIQGIHRQPIHMAPAAPRARRGVASRSRTILSLPRTRPPPVLPNGRPR